MRDYLIFALGVLLCISSTTFMVSIAIDSYKESVIEAQQENQQRIENLEAALLRGDEILEQIYPGWDRQKPVFSKQVKVTAYTSRPEETDDTPYINASNQTVRPGTIAVSRDLLEEVGGFGSLVILAGYGTFEVADVMNRRYTNSVDIWMGDLEAARLHGPQTTQMIWQ